MEEEVERAAALLRTLSKGKKITKVEAVEDAIVFSGTTHTEFVNKRHENKSDIHGRLLNKLSRLK